MEIKLDLSHLDNFLRTGELETYAEKTVTHLKALVDGTGKGADFLGWVNLPGEAASQVERIISTARRLRGQAETTVVIGIGGSYLGAKAIIEALSSTGTRKDNHRVIFAGHQMSEDYLASLKEQLTGKSFNIVVISKSGTTTEPAIAFRILRQMIDKESGHENSSRYIVAVTDQSKGALKKMADLEGYETYIIPDNVGGRYSVLTPVGLIPVAIAGFDISKLVEGAGRMAEITRDNKDSSTNMALKYAAARNMLYSSGRKIEMLVNFEPGLHYIAEWWKQLFGESEGKEGKGIFPAAGNFTTDLHSLGQYIQEGERILFETVLSVTSPALELRIPHDLQNHDGLNFISGMRISEVNARAEEGTIQAHVDGGVPVIRIVIPEINEATLGQILYFFEISCALSGYSLGINPFDQPGVEAYKKNMFRLLGKPGA